MLECFGKLWYWIGSATPPSSVTLFVVTFNIPVILPSACASAAATPRISRLGLIASLSSGVLSATSLVQNVGRYAARWFAGFPSDRRQISYLEHLTSRRELGSLGIIQQSSRYGTPDAGLPVNISEMAFRQFNDHPELVETPGDDSLPTAFN